MTKISVTHNLNSGAGGAETFKERAPRHLRCPPEDFCDGEALCIRSTGSLQVLGSGSTLVQVPHGTKSVRDKSLARSCLHHACDFQAILCGEQRLNGRVPAIRSQRVGGLHQS